MANTTNNAFAATSYSSHRLFIFWNDLWQCLILLKTYLVLRYLSLVIIPFKTLSMLATMTPYEVLKTVHNLARSDLFQMQIQLRYQNQLVNRNAQQRAKLLSPDFKGVSIDEILARLEDPSIEHGFQDWRNCLVFWARPPEAVRNLISSIQQRLLRVCPNLWIMKSPDLHMTALEISHSLTGQQIDVLVDQILPHAREITDYTYNHRARLVRPHLNFDTQSLALQFLPAVGEPDRSLEEDAYTYHHLRRDLFSKVQQAGIQVASRYITPSAHLTISRFITKRDFETADGEVDHEKVKDFVATIDAINRWLKEEYWPTKGNIKQGGEWTVGEEKGLECRKGTLWYGGGETVCLGKGF